MNRNRIVTDDFSDENSRRLYSERWPDEPGLAERVDEGEQCGGCSFYAPFNADEDHFSTEAEQRCQNHYGMGNMSRNKRTLSEEAIDELVTTEAGDDTAWENPVRVRRSKATAFELPSELAARAAFFARLHRTPHVQDWVRRVVQERLEMEEAAFAELKRELAAK